VARCGGLFDPGTAHGLSSLGPRRHRTYGTPGTSRTSTPRPGQRLARIARRGSAPGPAGRPVHRGYDPCGCMGRPDTRRDPQASDDRHGADPVGIRRRCAPPTRCPYQRWSYPGPSRPGERGVGLSRSRQRQSPRATPAGASPHADPRQPLQGASAPVSTLPTLEGRGHNAHQVVVAIARTLVGFRWAMATQVAVTP
jgi:hypothetical protein